MRPDMTGRTAKKTHRTLEEVTWLEPSQGVHFFDEDAPLFQAISKLADLRRNWIVLRRGRQYMHDISGDGVHFGPPTKFGDRLRTLVTWSRVMADNELLIAFNADELDKHEIYSMLNPNLRKKVMNCGSCFPTRPPWASSRWNHLAKRSPH